MTGDKLIPIPVAELEELQRLYGQNTHEQETIYNLLQNYINWLTIDGELKKCTISSLNGSWRTNGTFIIEDHYFLYVSSLEDTNGSVTRALDLIDWSFSRRISALQPRYWPAVREVWSKQRVQQKYHVTGAVRFMSKEDALKLDLQLPVDVRVGTLSATHTAMVNSMWPNAEEGSEPMVSRLILCNPTVALFRKSSNELLAWCLCIQTGALGNLYVLKEHSRQGYGTLAAKLMAKKLAEMGVNPYAYVLDSNAPSRAMFDKAGFQTVGSLMWVRNVASTHTGDRLETDAAAMRSTPIS